MLVPKTIEIGRELKDGVLIIWCANPMGRVYRIDFKLGGKP